MSCDGEMIGAPFAGEGSALEIGVYSAHATRILLEIYPAATGASAKVDYWLAKGPDDVWRAEIASVPGKTLYAFRAWGPNWPFDSAWTPGDATYQGMPRRAFDTGPFAPKSVALVDATDTGAKPGIAAADAVIYEAHVRGLTAHPSAAAVWHSRTASPR